MAEQVGDQRLVGEAEDVVEILGGILRIAAGMRAAQHGDGAAAAAEVAQRIGGLGRAGEGADEEDVGVLRQLGGEILDAGVAEIAHLMAELLARSEEHTSELQSLMRISYAVFCLQKQKTR